MILVADAAAEGLTTQVYRVYEARIFNLRKICVFSQLKMFYSDVENIIDYYRF